jgi:hypothetical protein
LLTFPALPRLSGEDVRLEGSARPLHSIGAARGQAAFWTVLTLCVLGIKILILTLDPLPLFVIGDSEVYLNSAISPAVPFDRSIVYGTAFIRPILATFGTTKAIVVAQMLLASCSALLAGVCARIGFRTPLWIVALAALAYAVDPLALIHERLIMTEGVALFGLALFVLVGLCYIESQRLSWLILLAVCSTWIVSLRPSFVPLLLICAVFLPVLGPLRSESTRLRPQWQLLSHQIISVAVTILFHSVYMQYLAYSTGRAPSYNSGSGLFLIASWAPLITRDDFPDPAVFDSILPELGFDLTNRFNRLGHRFADDGLCELLATNQGDYDRANRLAEKVALNAGSRNPLGVLDLGWKTYNDLWNRELMRQSILTDQGQRELDQSLIDFFKSNYSEDISRRHLTDTPVKQWHRLAFLWYRFLLLSPLISAAVIIACPTHRRAAVFLTALVCGLMTFNCLTSTEPVVRYLHSISWLTIVLFAPLMCISLHKIKVLWCSSTRRYVISQR